MVKMNAAAELVLIPSPGVGHLLSAEEIAKQLVGRDPRLSITIFIMKLPYDQPIQDRQLAAAEDRLRFVHLPHDEEAATELLSKSPGKFMTELINMNTNAVRDYVTKMISVESEAGESSQLAGFVIDMFCTPMIDVANEFGVPTYAFFTSGAAVLGLVFHLHTLHRDHNQDITEFKTESDAELDVPTFFNPLPAKVLPSVVFDKEGGAALILEIGKRLRETKGIMVNTFAELESHALKALAEDDKVPPVYPVGPILSLKSGEAHEEEEEESVIMRWLDNQPPSSVVFLCFGSMGSFEGEQVREIALALERCRHRFLWSVRKPPPKGKIGVPSEYEDLNQVLPERFLERTVEMGRVIGWAPQVAVLSHEAVGGFVSHCGWNSTLESLWCGVPMATWPMRAEQQANAFQLVRELGLAVKIKLDYRMDKRTDSGEVLLVTAEEIESGIKQLMESDNKHTQEIRKKVREMSEKSKIGVVEGGSSYNSLGFLIEDVINNNITLP